MQIFIVVLETSGNFYDQQHEMENIKAFNTLEDANAFVSNYMKDEFGNDFMDDFDTVDEFIDEYGCKHIEAVDLEGCIMNLWVNAVNKA